MSTTIASKGYVFVAMYVCPLILHWLEISMFFLYDLILELFSILSISGHTLVYFKFLLLDLVADLISGSVGSFFKPLHVSFTFYI